MSDTDVSKITGLISEQAQVLDRVRDEIMKIMVGQKRLLDRMTIALIASGHILLEGVPGLAKTTAVKTMARALGLKFQRISFTPDLLPADIIGTMVYDPKTGVFTPKKGPVFTNLLLADEINRAPAKVQSALLEAMQERQVTIGSETYPLPEPFLVMATQNPIEQEGTYPLPEAQIDRFMLKCKITYPDRNEERRIMDRFTRKSEPSVEAVMTSEQISVMRDLLDQIYCDEKVCEYILDLVIATREPEKRNIPIAHQIEYGASPRASLYLNLASRANAMLHGRGYATPQDVKEIAHDVLRHRVMLTYEAEAEEVTSDDIVTRLLGEIPVP